jgi:hypothetical protein
VLARSPFPRSLVATLAAIALCACSSGLQDGAARRDPRLAWLIGTWRSTGSTMFEEMELTATIDPSGALVWYAHDARSGKDAAPLPGHVLGWGDDVLARLFDPAGLHPPVECRIVPSDVDTFRTFNLPNAREGCGTPNPFRRVR